MRRFARLLLVGALTFSLAACGSESDSAEQQDTADLFGNNPGTRITEAIDYMIETLDSAKK